METMQIVHLCVSAVSLILVWALVFQRLAELRARREKTAVKASINRIEMVMDDPDKIANRFRRPPEKGPF